MDGETPLSCIETRASFIDILYLTSDRSVPGEIKRLLNQKRLSCRILAPDRFNEMRDKLHLIGTVIVDTGGCQTSEQRLARIIECLELEHIGVIILKGSMKVPVRSFSLSPTKTSFSLSKPVEDDSIDELWTRINVNLAYRKGIPSMAVKPLLPPRPVHTVFKNKLEEQLDMTKVLADSLTEQLRLAGLVQQDFLPAKLPNTDETQWGSIFLPAEWVSGDIYDVARVDEQHIGFYVADVVGHGMPAALLTIFLKQALVMRETIGSNYRVFSPAEVVKNLNLRMTAQKLSGYQFATACYCLLNTKTLRLTFARAGHPYPLLIRPGEPPKQLEVRGSLLGIFEQAEYLQETVQLQPGDKLLMYSDGAEPFIGHFDDQSSFVFNEDFCTAAQQPIGECLDSLNILMKNRQIEVAEIDDITMLGLEITSSFG